MSSKTLVAFTCLAIFTSLAHADAIVDVVSKYGKADRVTSSESEKPTPPILTKFLEYRKQGVRFVFVPDGPVGSKPPIKNWKLLAAQDIAGGKDGGKLSDAQVTERMSTRVKK